MKRFPYFSSFFMIGNRNIRFRLRSVNNGSIIGSSLTTWKDKYVIWFLLIRIVFGGPISFSKTRKKAIFTRLLCQTFCYVSIRKVMSSIRFAYRWYSHVLWILNIIHWISRYVPYKWLVVSVCCDVKFKLHFKWFLFHHTDGYTTEDLMFVWKKEDPVQITTNLHLPRFTLEKYLTDYCTSKTNTGMYHHFIHIALYYCWLSIVCVCVCVDAPYSSILSSSIAIIIELGCKRVII